MSTKPSSLFAKGIVWGAAVSAAYYFLVRPRILSWGASEDEALSEYSGDARIPAPAMKTTRAITIQAEPGKIWAWLIQLGQGRGGFYSYDWLENLLGMNIHNVNAIDPELQKLDVGDEVPFWQGVGLKVLACQAPHLLVLGGSLYRDGFQEVDISKTADASMGGLWIFAIEPLPGGDSRLIVRSVVARFEPAWLCRLILLLLEPAHFIMERKMMLELKERAENRHH